MQPTLTYVQVQARPIRQSGGFGRSARAARSPPPRLVITAVAVGGGGTTRSSPEAGDSIRKSVETPKPRTAGGCAGGRGCSSSSLSCGFSSDRGGLSSFAPFRERGASPACGGAAEGGVPPPAISMRRGASGGACPPFPSPRGASKEGFVLPGGTLRVIGGGARWGWGCGKCEGGGGHP